MKNVVSLHFTNECNGDCPFCYREKGKETMDEKLFLDLPRFPKDITDQVTLGGGEPTLRPELVERFAEECSDYDLVCNVTTNGFLFKEWNDEKIGEFCENLTMVSVSLDWAKYKYWKTGNEYLDTCSRVKKHALVGCNLLVDEDLTTGNNLIKMADRLFEKRAVMELICFAEEQLDMVILQSKKELDKRNKLCEAQGLRQKQRIDHECVREAIKTINNGGYSSSPERAGGKKPKTECKEHFSEKHPQESTEVA